jgi:hypothetical protein
MASPVPIATPTPTPIIKSRIPLDGKLPAVSIIKETRVPRELQKIFLESSRGSSVKQAPPGVTFTRNWLDKTKISERKKQNRLLFVSREKHIVFDRNLPVPSHRVGEGEKNAGGCGDTRWASACTQGKCNAPPRAPSRRSQGEWSPHASPRGKIYAAPRPLNLNSISRLSLGLSASEESSERPMKQCVQMNAQPPKRPVRSTNDTSVCDEDSPVSKRSSGQPFTHGDTSAGQLLIADAILQF